MAFSVHALDIDPVVETDRIVSMLRHSVGRVLRRRGVVLGISGGVDSSVVFALCIRAFGPERVVALMLPEKDSEASSEDLARDLARRFGVEPILENITGVLDGFGCYRRRDEAIRRVFPAYDPVVGYTAKIVLPRNVLDDSTLNVFSLTVIAPDGTEESKRLPLAEFFQIVAASNFKQRSRMAFLYFHAEANNYAVVGTANKDEHRQGFFVKYGDGGVDVRPIVHLFKTQVYQLAEYLDIPEEIRSRTPTSDTYSATQTQEEFFFRMPFKTMDLLWYAQETNVPIPEVARVMNLTEEQVQRAFHDFTSKQRTTEYLRTLPLEVEVPDM